MRLSDIGSGLVGLIFGLWLVYEGYDLGLGEPTEPGSGFILFWVGVVVAGLSVGLIGSGFGARAADGGAGGEVETGPVFGARWRKVPVVLAYIVAYAALLEAVGFIPLTILLLILLFKTVEPQSWRAAILYSVAITLTVYLFFGVGLGTRFPAGVLEPLLIG